MSDLRLGVLGCGFIGSIHLGNASRIAGVSVTAVADIDPAAARRAHERFGGRYWTTDSGRLITDPGLDAVLICSHAGSHAELAIAAMNAGKHVFVEKPMAVTAQEARAMVETAQQTGMRLGVDLKFRFATALRRVHNAVPAPVLLVGQAAVNPLPASAPQRIGPDSLGIAEDLAPHVFDTLCHLAGQVPRMLHAQATRHRRPGLDGCIAAVAGTLSFDNGTLASFVIGDPGEWPHASRWFFEVSDGATRAVITDHCRKTMICKDAAGAPGDPETFSESVPPHEVGTCAALTDFANAITERRDPTAGPADGLRSVLLVEALRQAVRTGAPARLDLESPAVGAGSNDSAPGG